MASITKKINLGQAKSREEINMKKNISLKTYGGTVGCIRTRSIGRWQYWPINPKHIYSSFYHLVALLRFSVGRSRRKKTKIKTHFDGHQSRSVTNIKFKESVPHE